MKKKILVLAVLLAGLTTLVFTGCSDDDDTTPPVVTLNGDPAPVISLQSNFVDLGAVATDDEDGSLIAVVSGTVNNDKVGSYTLTYTATDGAGNEGTATRVVTVINDLDSDPWEGSYDCTITSGPCDPTTPVTYTESLSVSSTLNNGLEWSKFGDYPNANAKLNIIFGTNNQVIIPDQVIVCGTTPVARTFTGSGTKVGSGGAGSSIILNITETVNSNSCSYVYTYSKN